MRTIYARTGYSTPTLAELRILIQGIVLVVALFGLTYAPPAFAGLGADAFAAGDYQRALTILEPQAKRGHPEAQYLLGRMRERGLGLRTDKQRSLYWYQLAAAQGHAQAGAALASVTGSPGAAYAPVALPPPADAVQEMQRILIGGISTNQAHAARLAQAVAKRAEAGDPALAVLLGQYFEASLGGKPDFKAAARWYQRAAAKRHPVALNNLGAMFYDGRGVQQSYTEAQRYYQSGAESGNSVAQVNLALMLGTGRGGKADLPNMISWLQKAADQQDARAEELLARSYSYGIGVPLNLPEAARYYQLSANRGYPRSYYELGRMLIQGLGVTRDPERGAEWILKAADAGVVDADLEAARLLEHGLGTATNSARALEYYQRAGYAGSAEAAERLARAYTSGELDLRPNPSEAAHWAAIAKNGCRLVSGMKVCPGDATDDALKQN